jgi:Flp pilus assembly protein CpaB
LVLAVGQETAGLPIEQGGRYKKEEKKEVSPLITLALSPQEANLIAFVQEQGKIRLLLRSPSDSQIGQLGLTSWDTLFQYVMPQEIAKPEPKAKEEAPSDVVFVEIYRGLNKEKVPLPK